jgi:hypothetical protein
MGGGTYSFPASAATTTLVSSSASDAAGGTGCRAVIVSGLLTSGTSQQDHSPNGNRLFIINAKSDVRMRAVTVDANNIGVQCNVAGFLIKDDSVIY